jgi:hypothetical protein
MKKKIIYAERQRFAHPVIWIFLITMLGFWGYAAYLQLFLKLPFGDKPASDTFLIFSGVILILIVLFFLVSFLELKLMENRLHVKFFPFHLKPKVIPFESLTELEVRQYKPLSEFGGWGLRYSLGKSGKAYTISGNQGLQLTFQDKKKLLIGTKRPERLREALIESWRLHTAQKTDIAAEPE